MSFPVLFKFLSRLYDNRIYFLCYQITRHVVVIFLHAAHEKNSHRTLSPVGSWRDFPPARAHRRKCRLVDEEGGNSCIQNASTHPE